MPRRQNLKPTSIYWLFDMRPETISSGWPNGRPFYCGKTVAQPTTRLIQHRSQAKNNPHGNVGARVVDCDQFIRIRVMEIVPLGDDWVAREKYWIATGRFLYPGLFLNVSDGGAGAPGNVVSEEVRAKISNSLRGVKKSPEHAAKVGLAIRGRQISPEHREIVRAANLGRKLSAEHRAKISAGNKGKQNSPESREKLRLANTGRKFSPQHREKLRLANIGKKLSPESVAKRSATVRRLHLISISACASGRAS